MSINVNIRPMTKTERMYCYTQSTQIMAQTGCIGHMVADMDTNGEGFYSKWFDHCTHLKTDKFKEEFDELINELRFNEKYEGILKNRNSMSKYCLTRIEAVFDNDMCEFGFRADTEEYTYMLRLDIRKGENNLYCYCYMKNWLDQHIQMAQNGIRIIDVNYNNLFMVPDGGYIVITEPNGTEREELCRYIDAYHFEIGNNSILMHFCEFAERMQAAGNTVRPKDRGVE